MDISEEILQPHAYIVQPLSAVIQEDQVQGCADENVGKEAKPIAPGNVGLANQIQTVTNLIVFPMRLTDPQTEETDFLFSETQMMLQRNRGSHPAAVATGFQAPAKIPVGQIQEEIFIPKVDGFNCAVAAKQGRGDGTANGEAIIVG